MDFNNELKKKRVHLSEGSLKTYNSLLKTIYKKVFENTDKPDIEKFKEQEKILKFLEDKSSSSRKTYLASLICIAPDVEEYKKVMNKDMADYKEEMDKQVMNDKQAENNISSSEIFDMWKDYKKTADFLYKKKSLSISDLQQIQDFILISLLGGVFVVPRRSLDYVAMKYKNYDEDKDNYILKNKFIFHKFKTAKFHKEGQSLDIPPALKKILNKWISVIPEDIDTLLFNSNFEELSSITLNQRFNKIFRGKISVNQMRHTYLTERYGAMMQKQKDMAVDMDNMGSSLAQSKVYVKLDDPDIKEDEVLPAKKTKKNNKKNEV